MKKIIHKKYISHRNLPINLIPEDSWLFKSEYKKLIQNSYLLFCKNLYVKNLEIYKFKNFQKHYKHTKMNNYIFLKKLKIFLKELFSKNNSKKISILDKGMWILDEKSFHYFHWFCDTLPRFIQARDFNNEYPLIIPDNLVQKDYIKFCLDFFKIKFITYNQKEVLKIKKLLISSHVSNSGNYQKENIQFISRLLKGDEVQNQKKERIWISRLHSKHRKIQNEDSLLGILEKYNFKIVYPEKLDFFEQVQIYYNAEIIAGLHGGGLTNIIFMNPSSKVLEIRRKNDATNNCYFSLASDLDIDYYYLQCKSLGNDLYVSDAFVDPDQLEKAIMCLIK